MPIRLPTINPQDPPSGRVAPAVSGGLPRAPAAGAGLEQAAGALSQFGDQLERADARQQRLSAIRQDRRDDVRQRQEREAERDRLEAARLEQRSRALRAGNLIGDTFTNTFDAAGGFFDTVGESASNENLGKTLKSIDDKIKQKREQLQTDYERQLFDSEVEDRRSAYYHRAVQHVAKQARVSLVGAQQARLTASVNDAVMAISTVDPEGPAWNVASAASESVGGPSFGPSPSDRAARAATEKAVQSTHDLATTLGVPAEVRAQMLHNTTDSIHSGVVRQLLTIDDGTAAAQAKHYLDNVPQEQLDPDTIVALRDQIGTQGRSDAARAHAAELLSDRAAEARKKATDEAKKTAAAVATSRALDPTIAPGTAGPSAASVFDVSVDAGGLGPGEQGPPVPSSNSEFVNTYRQRQAEWEQRVQWAFAAAEAQTDPDYRDALFAELRNAVSRHDTLLARSKNEARAQAEAWIQSHAGPAEWRSAPAELQQQAAVHGLTDELISLGRSRVKESNQTVREFLFSLSDDEWRERFANGHDSFVAEFGGQLNQSDMRWATNRAAQAFANAIGLDATEASITDHADGIAIANGIDPKSKHPDDISRRLLLRDRLVDKIRIESGRAPKDRRSFDVLAKELAGQAPILLDPKALRKGPGGRSFAVEQILVDPLKPGNMNPRVLKRAADNHLDPGDPLVLDTIGETLLREDRDAFVRDITSQAKASGLVGIPSRPGYVSLHDAMARTGFREDELLSLVREAQDAAGGWSGEPFLTYDTVYYAQGLGNFGPGPVGYRRSEVPIGVSWEALAMLARDQETREKLTKR